MSETVKRVVAPVETLEAVTRTMGRAIDNAAAQREQVRADARYTDQYRATLNERIDAEERAGVIGALKRLWGDPNTPDGTLEGGSIWRAIERAEGDLKAARETAALEDNIPQLELEYARVPSQLAQLDSLTDFETWYANATQYERRAVQDTGIDLIKSKYPGDDRMGSVLARLQSDQKAVRASHPAVVEAQHEHDRVFTAAAQAWEASRSAAGTIGDRAYGSEAQQILGRIDARASYPDPSDWHGRSTFSIEKRPPQVTITTGEKAGFTVGG